ncbi:hypothetical protein [Actinokineospora sp. HUAS TT18]|uniref:hypothetical protein n=1 Tax=Actinokineospora sp. HUAS TT18 TaxID=3447451 RepID=UPI003F52646D
MIRLEDTDIAKALAMLAAKAPLVSAAIIREDLAVEQVDALLTILANTTDCVRELRFRWFGVEIEDLGDSGGR